MNKRDKENECNYQKENVQLIPKGGLSNGEIVGILVAFIVVSTFFFWLGDRLWKKYKQHKQNKLNK